MKPNTKQRDAKAASKRHSKVYVDGVNAYLAATAVDVSLQSGTPIVVNKVVTPTHIALSPDDKKSCNK